MANVYFVADRGVYVTLVDSDSDPRTQYEIAFDPERGEFACGCPAFQYSRDRHCKHIARGSGRISDYLDELEPEKPTDDDRGFEVSLNGGPQRVLDQSTVEWLLGTIGVGTSFEVQRVR